ncbi:MAG: hypothetical protein M1825_000235 [Sarcosagium campestre]|nr:MAG: hypothetical protein M1825_000235 [Sarcosagium campestre]
MAPSRPNFGVTTYGWPSSTLKPSKYKVTPRVIERIQCRTPVRKSTRLDKKSLSCRLESQEQAYQFQSPTSIGNDKEAPRDLSPSGSSSSRKRKRKQSHEPKSVSEKVKYLSPQDQDEPGLKRLRISAASCAAENTSNREAASSNSNDPLIYWNRTGHWPKEYFEQDDNMSQLSLTQRQSSVSLSHNKSGTSGVTFREGKNPAVKNPRYVKTLASAGIYMGQPEPYLRSSDNGKALCQTMLDTDQPVPKDSLFEDDLFESTCEDIADRNEARVIQEIARLIVPSPEQLARRGAKHLKRLIENVNEGWIKSIPLVNGPRPQPDFSVGLRSTAFTRDQLKKLEPHIGDWRDTSRLVATDDMYFPFLTAEVKCGNEGLNIADRQNAHSASVAVNAVIALYRAVSRQHELHRQILAFSVSHDHETVRIYGHYPLINGQEISFYRHPIKKFDITNEDGRERWTAYKFTRNVYDKFVPTHLERICAAIDKLPDPEVFLVEPLGVGLLSRQSNAESIEQDDSQSAPSYSQGSAPRLPSSNTTEPLTKKPRGRSTRK